MNGRMNEKIEAALAKNRRRLRRNLLLAFAALLLGGTIWGQVMRKNVLAATYKEKVLTCSYTPASGPGAAGYAVHVHNDDCRDWQGELVCPLPEIPPHVHGEGCFETVQTLTCGLEETPGHQHDESCYTETAVPVCGMEETRGIFMQIPA